METEEYFDRHFSSLAVISEASDVLELAEVSSATACVLYHRVVTALMEKSMLEKIDKTLIAATCLYLASKVEEQPKKIRDVINICHRLICKDEQPLEIGSTYWKLRDSVVSFELYLLRLLNFDVTFPSPHKFLLCSLEVLTDYIGKSEPRCASLCHISWVLLKDIFYVPSALKYSPELLSVAVIYTAMHIVGLNVPNEPEWWKILGVNCEEDEIQSVAIPLFTLYEWDATCGGSLKTQLTR